MFRYRLRTLLILLALGPPIMAAPWYVSDSVRFAFGVVAAVTAMLFGAIFLPHVLDP